MRFLLGQARETGLFGFSVACFAGIARKTGHRKTLCERHRREFADHSQALLFLPHNAEQ
jgi:hypothetical protein